MRPDSYGLSDTGLGMSLFNTLQSSNTIRRVLMLCTEYVSAYTVSEDMKTCMAVR
jgi:hypothetical protein